MGGPRGSLELLSGTLSIGRPWREHPQQLPLNLMFRVGQPLLVRLFKLLAQQLLTVAVVLVNFVRNLLMHLLLLLEHSLKLFDLLP